MGFIQACGFLVWLLRTEQSQLKMLVTEQLMQPAACYRMGKEIDTPYLSKELVVVLSGLLVKIEYLFPTELESA